MSDEIGLTEDQCAAIAAMIVGQLSEKLTRIDDRLKVIEERVRFNLRAPDWTL